MKVHIGSDHAGFELKEYLKDKLNERGIEVKDHGTYSTESVDYPDYAHETALAVEADRVLGILICGSANGNFIARIAPYNTLSPMWMI